MKLRDVVKTITFFIFGVVFSFVCLKYMTNIYISRAVNNYCDENTIFFRISDLQKSNIYDSESNLKWVIAEISYNYFAVNDINNSLTWPMLQGNFFKTSKEYKYKVVIGRNYANDIFYINDDPFIKLNNMDFYVCGIIGFNTPTPLDKNIYFDMKDIYTQLSDDIVFYTNDIAVLNRTDIYEVNSNLLSYEYFLQVNIYLFIFDILIIVLIIIVYFTVIYICHSTKNENYILFILGYTRKRVVMFNYKKLFKVFLICFELGVFTECILYYFSSPFIIELSVKTAIIISMIVNIVSYILVYIITYIFERSRFKENGL